MGVHHVSWLATASGLEDESLVAEAMAWLIGDSESVRIEKTTSFHGSTVNLVTAELLRKGPATKSLARLGVDAIDAIMSDIESRLDDDNVLHIRLDLLELLAGRVKVCLPSSRASIKGRTKLQVYPGDDPHQVAISTLEDAKNSV